MPLVHEHARDPSWARVEVLVRAPHREISAPVMQCEGYVPRRVRKVPSHHHAPLPCIGSDGWDIEQLASVVLYSWEKQQGSRGGVRVDDGEDLRSR